jgi:hypothetical protein
MSGHPSFLKEIFSVLWLMAKITVPIGAWLFLCVWLAQRNLVITYALTYGGILVAMVIFFAWSNYKWKLRSLATQEQSSKSRNMIRELLDSTGVSKQRAASLPSFEGIAKQMPLDYLEPEPLKLFEVPADQDAYVNFTAIAVDLNGSTWVDTEVSLYAAPNFTSVTVRRLETGYRLTLPQKKADQPKMKFTPKPRLSTLTAYAPVVEIVEDDEGLKAS